MVPKTQQRGDYWVLYNYVTADKRFKCHESITYSTHADYSFMDNLVPLVERWKGPVSIAMHAPGSDFENTIDSIAYLRDCTTPLIKEYVTFHVFFSTKHVPKEVRVTFMLNTEKSLESYGYLWFTIYVLKVPPNFEIFLYSRFCFIESLPCRCGGR